MPAEIDPVVLNNGGDMKLTGRSIGVALAVAGMLASGAVLADKGGKGNGKGKQADKQHYDKGERSERRDDGKGDRHEGRHAHFDDRHRSHVRDYYGAQHRRGFCPPGLAKKQNGCMPPGQAKKWRVGQPLPREVVYYRVPDVLVQQIGPPPAGYRYVRVASDILMMSTGTRMIVDAIQDLGRI